MTGAESHSALPPFLGLTGNEADAGFARFHLLPVPYDGTSLERSGARHGPEAILRASRLLERHDEELMMDPSRLGIATAPPITAGVGGPEALLERVHRTVAQTLSAGKTPILLGGEHAITAAAGEAALAAAPRLTLLHIDAHADLRESWQGSIHSHACALRRLSERTHLVSVGLRSVAAEEMPLLSRDNVRAHLMHAVRRRPFSEAVTEISEAVRRHVYISIDLDALDPSIMPSVPRPEPGGLLWWELLAILRAVIARSMVVGVDVVNLAPVAGLEAPNRLGARLVQKIIGYIAKCQAFWRPGGGADDAPTVPVSR